MNLLSNNSNPLHDFLSISTWQTVLAVVLFFGTMAGMWLLIKKTKLKFIYRVLSCLVLGLVFGIVVQAINGFPFDHAHPTNSMIDPTYQANGATYTNPIYQLWVQEFSVWVDLIKMIFMNAILLVTVPVVFLAIVRAVSRPTASRKIGRSALINALVLLANVAVIYLITLAICYVVKIGNGFTIPGSGEYTKDASKPLPVIIYNYVPSNFVGTFTGTLIIPVMVIAGLIGFAVKKSSKRHPEQCEAIRAGVERWWTITMSVLMTIVKIMPFAVMSMITNAIMTRPIGYLAQIGIIIGMGWACCFIAMAWHTLTITLSGINPLKWWMSAVKVFLQGFTTQSSNATLPVLMETLKDDLKVDDNLVGVGAPLSTTMGLSCCAGVQSGIVVAFISTAGYFQMNPTNFFIALIVVVIASLGIAGIPGTAGVVTAGVLGGIGLGSLYAPVYSVIGALDGLFDMARTGGNVIGGMQATTLSAVWTKQLYNQELFWTRHSHQKTGPSNDL